jgi:Na+-translocating ferredoxin:NAD+ oxidoreductase RNF subunit RnfB
MDDAVDAMAPQSACELCSDGGCDATATALWGMRELCGNGKK